MRWIAALVALCGCNQVLGIGESIQADAQQYDAQLDAPYACPPPGTAPQFSRVLRQVSTRNCNDYSASVDTNRTVAHCEDASGRGIAEGTVDHDDLKQAVGLEPDNGVISHPRMTPEGDELYLQRWVNALPTISIYRRDAAGWTLLENLSIPVGNFEAFTGVTRGPVRRVYLFGDAILRELLSDGAGGWTEVGRYGYTELGVVNFSDPRVSADGLRMVMTGARTGDPSNLLLYADRATVTSRFGPAKFLADVANVYGASLAEDCSRLYFSALQSVFYVRQN